MVEKLCTINDQELTGETYKNLIKDIMELCKIKRNSLHFWHTPDSVAEFETLLDKYKIESPINNKLKF